MTALGGMFANRTATRGGPAAKQAKDRRANDTLDRFADLLADEVKPEMAAERLGFNPAYGRVLLQRIRKRLGDQAR